MAYFPLFVNLDGKNILVVGGGKIASRRVRALLDFGCKIRVVAPEISEELKVLVESGRVEWTSDCYNSKVLLQGKEQTKTKVPYFVLAASIADVNRNVVDDCRRIGIPVNDASNKDNCDFYFPGIAKEESVVVGITSGGSDHKLAAALTARIRELFKK